MKPKTKHSIYKMINQIFIIINLCVLVLAVSVFFIGFHNVDLSHNVLKLSYMENLTYTDYYDITSNGSSLTYDDGYILGLNQMTMAVILLAFSLINALAYILSKEIKVKLRDVR